MLFKEQKREQIKLKAKPGVVELAEELYRVAYPFADEANLDNLFEELVIRKALEMEIVAVPQVAEPVEKAVEEESLEAAEEDENAGTLEVGELLGA